MKTKRNFGMGVRKRKRGDVSFRRGIVQKITKALKPAPTLKKAAVNALKAAKLVVKKAGGKKRVRLPRIIPFDHKSGGILPLLPILAALGSLGALAGGASAVAKTVIDTKTAQKKLEEDRRHNKAMESIGKGLYLKRNAKGGFGLFLKRQKNF
ncbi:unnamed protein product [Psylliodes chrysocephalus]|uniref:Uncharacterized protein n=1 Tax=Psylliodes chrysocephalus TaxID=3402493 RepID=A0A9P0CVC6_9CUCU|nr:unnamed protein product [Psylliodes chrysocephala]